MANRMVLYSIVDISDVLYENYYESVSYVRGKNVESEKNHNSLISADNTCTKRPYSTNPAHYLDKRYYPY